MEEAFELESYLPLSYKSESEGDYVAFLWEAFRTNYEHGKYQFAFLAYHMLTMCCVYFNIWQIKLMMPQAFKNAMIGFDRETERELTESTSPFMFWRVKESAVMRFLKLLGCDDNYVGRCAALVKERNDSAHANGNIFFNDAKLMDKKIAEVLSVVDDIEVHSKPLIEQCYLKFLQESQDPEEREHEDDENQLREVLIYENYFSQKDVDVCVRADVSSLRAEPRFEHIHRLHRLLRNRFSELEASMTLGRPGSKIKLKGREWERMVEFLTDNGWKTTCPVEMLLLNDAKVNEDDAASLADAVKSAREGTLKDPMTSHVLGFDISKFSEVGTLAENGPFSVWVSIKPATTI